jgi:hypothetical protein
MKRALAALLAGVVLGGTATAGAATQWYHRSYGIICKSDAATHSVACVRSDGNGYGIGISRDVVLVMNTDTGRDVFHRYQP